MNNTNIVSQYTTDQAIEDGQLAKLENGMILTAGVYALKGKGFDSIEDDYLFETKLIDAVNEELAKQPEVSTDGGNDKDFFTLTWRGTKFFAVRNELETLSIMLPEEY